MPKARGAISLGPSWDRGKHGEGRSTHRGVFGPALEPPAAPWEGEELPPSPPPPPQLSLQVGL